MVVETFDVLNRYEKGMEKDGEKGTDDYNESLTPRTSWSVEAIKWVETHDIIHDQNPLDTKFESGRELGMMQYSSFAKACSLAKTGNDDTLRVDFCDSTKDRTSALMHVFHPFLQDIFVYNVVNTIFDKMRISHDIDKLLQVRIFNSNSAHALSFADI